MMGSQQEQGLGVTLSLQEVSGGTRLLEQKRQMFEVQEALEAEKSEFLRQEEAFKRREEGLRRKDVELQDSLIKFNKFLQENEAKRKRAVARAGEERKQTEQKTIDVARLESLREAKLQCAARLEKDFLRNKVCQDFLTEVCSFSSEDYQEIRDLLNRHETLKRANDDLAQRQKLVDDQKEQTQEQLMKFTKEKSNDILNANNEIARLQDKLEAAQRTSYRLQNDVDSNIRTVSDTTLELCQILTAVDNLLERFQSHLRAHKHPSSSQKQQQATTSKQTTTTQSATNHNKPPRGPPENSPEIQNNNAKKKQANCTAGCRDKYKTKKNDTDQATLEGQLAIDRLDDISTYMIDFADICQDYELNLKKQQQAQHHLANNNHQVLLSNKQQQSTTNYSSHQQLH